MGLDGAAKKRRQFDKSCDFSATGNQNEDLCRKAPAEGQPGLPETGRHRGTDQAAGSEQEPLRESPVQLAPAGREHSSSLGASRCPRGKHSND